MQLTWDKTLSTGITWQDEDHKELFLRIATLANATQQEEAPDQLLRFFSSLNEYIHSHFAKEVELMERFNYPERAEHIGEHQSFYRDMQTILAQIVESEFIDRSYVVRTLHRCYAYLKDHIGKTDKNLAAFLKEQGEPLPACAARL